MANNKSNDANFSVAVIGGGLVGLHVAIGLLARGVAVELYEQMGSFREIGAGLSLVPNGVRAMGLIDGRITGIYERVATASGQPGDAVNTYNYVDGHSHRYDDDNGDGKKHYDPETGTGGGLRPLFTVKTPQKGFESVRRADFLDELVKLLPPGVARLGKRLEAIEDRQGPGEKVLLRFKDGTIAEVDAVIGCDGVKSTVKKLLLGADHPASRAYYANMFTFRGVIPMSQAEEVTGTWLARNRMIMTGPDAHFVSYPIAEQTLVNLVGMATDDSPWPEGAATTVTSSKGEVASHFRDFGAAVRALGDCMLDDVSKWAMFDTAEHPAPTYFRGRVAIAGDAAHASTPHHGAGAAMGIEDALALAGMVPAVLEALRGGKGKGEGETAAAPPTTKTRSSADVVAAWFAAYDRTRRDRSQWVVASSRWTGNVFQWRNPDVKGDWARAEKEISERQEKIWYYDVGKMVDEAVVEFRTELDRTAG